MIFLRYVPVSGAWPFFAWCSGTNAAEKALASGNALLPPAGQVSRIKVVSDKAPGLHFAQIDRLNRSRRHARPTMRRPSRIYNFTVRLTHYHRAYPEERGGLPLVLRKEIHCYGWSLCGGLHAEQLFHALPCAKWAGTVSSAGRGHTTVEAFYDGRWHYLDVFLKFYAWMPDPKNPGKRTIAGQDDLQAEPGAFALRRLRLRQVAPGRLLQRQRVRTVRRQGQLAGAGVPGLRRRYSRACQDGVPPGRARAGSPEGWAGIDHKSGSYSADINLAPGFALTSAWDPIADAWHWNDSKVAPCHTCGDKEIRNSPEKGLVAEPYLGAGWKCESYANGKLTFHPDLTSDASPAARLRRVENVKAHWAKARGAIACDSASRRA